MDMNATAPVLKSWRRWPRRPRPAAQTEREAPVSRLIPHAASIGDVLADLDVQPDRGLSEQAARARLERDGPNLLDEAAPPSLVALFARQFKSAIVLLLVA